MSERVFSIVRDLVGTVDADPNVPGSEPARITITAGRLRYVPSRGGMFDAPAAQLEIIPDDTGILYRLETLEGDGPLMEGATSMGNTAAVPSNVGEMAARWNAASNDERAQMLDAWIENADIARRCVIHNHGAVCEQQAHDIVRLRERIAELEAQQR